MLYRRIRVCGLTIVEDGLFTEYDEYVLERCGKLKLISTADWPERGGLPQGYIALYKIGNYYVFTNNDGTDEYVYVISDDMMEAVDTARRIFENYARKYFEGEERERELREIKETFDELLENMRSMYINKEYVTPWFD